MHTAQNLTRNCPHTSHALCLARHQCRGGQGAAACPGVRDAEAHDAAHKCGWHRRVLPLLPGVRGGAAQHGDALLRPVFPTSPLPPTWTPRPSHQAPSCHGAAQVGVMMAGQGASGDVWSTTEQFLKVRRCPSKLTACAVRSLLAIADRGRALCSTCPVVPLLQCLSVWRRDMMGGGRLGVCALPDPPPHASPASSLMQERKRLKEAQEAASRQRPYSAAQEQARRWGKGRGGVPPPPACPATACELGAVAQRPRREGARAVKRGLILMHKYKRTCMRRCTHTRPRALILNADQTPQSQGGRKRAQEAGHLLEHG